MQETQVQYLGQEDSPGEEMATDTSILAWKIPWTEEPEGLQSIGLQRVKHSLMAKQQQDATVSMNLENIMLSRRSQTQKAAYHIIPFIQNIHVCKYIETKISVCQRLRKGKMWSDH